MIIHDNYQFTGTHEPIEEGPVQLPLQEISSPGTYGVSHMVGPPGSRPLRCRYTMDGFASELLVKVAVRDMQVYAGRLTGTVYISNGLYYPDCTFLGFTPDGPTRFSAGGMWGWVQFGWLEWIQRRV